MPSTSAYLINKSEVSNTLKENFDCQNSFNPTDVHFAQNFGTKG
jgi:hypothetical protein